MLGEFGCGVFALDVQYQASSTHSFSANWPGERLHAAWGVGVGRVGVVAWVLRLFSNRRPNIGSIYITWQVFTKLMLAFIFDTLGEKIGV